jgi:hypothetical protein|tara:strand:+ start:190 stop:903 length:714 start_codon:yes stop_codon:yes gene_type:complete
MDISIKRISASSLKLYQDCPYCWKLKYVYDLLQPEADALIIGTKVHNGIEMFHKGISPAHIIETVKREIFAIEDKKKAVARFKIIRECLEIYFRHPLKDDTIECEKRFNLKMPQCLPLFGFIDRIVPKGITEYKTTSVDYTQKDIENVQSKLYSYVYHRLNGTLPLVTYYVINKKKTRKKNYKPQILTIQYGDEVINEVESLCIKFYQDIQNGNFEPNKIKHWSPFKNLCPHAYVTK